MESPRLLLVVFFAGLSVVCRCASRSKMSSGRGRDDASDVTWAHAVNSRGALEKALAGPIAFLEADISLGHVEGSDTGSPAVPIMAHPPDTTSDISLDDWLDTVTKKRPDKGIKLDFKSLAVLEPSLITLQKYAHKLNSSVWLNADVLSGPVDSPATPVSVKEFLQLCHQHFANATLSVGWTTDWHPTLSRDTWRYGWRHVREMADTVQCLWKRSSGQPKFTFPVRGIFASRSIWQLRWLLSIVPGSTITVWTGRYDPLTLDDLLEIRSSFSKDAVYYDVPERLAASFNEKKNSVSSAQSHATVGNSHWMTFTRGLGVGCSSLTYVRDDVIVFGKSLATAVLQKNVLLVPGEDKNLKITGRVKFFDTTEQPGDVEKWQELSIVLADVSSFSKNASVESGKELDLTSSDSEVIWSVINSSVIYTFRHRKGEPNTSCRLFKLDSSKDKSFQVWTVPCDAMLEKSSFEDVTRNGVPDISSKKRLVLPEEPFLIGFMSSGDEHVALYDLEMKGHGVAMTSRSSPGKTLLMSSVVVSLFCALLFVLF